MDKAKDASAADASAAAQSAAAAVPPLATPAPAAAAAAAAVPPADPKPRAAPKSKAPVLTAAELAAQAAAEAAARAAQEAKDAIDDIPHQQMIKARIVDVKGRNAALAASVSSLHSQLSQSERDSGDVLRYLETEVRRKDMVTKQLGRELRELHAEQVAEKAARHAAYTAEIANLEQTFAQAEKELLALNKLRHQEHNDLLLFQRIRPDLLQELSHTKRTILKNERRHALQMSDLEKKFLAARSRLLEESAARIEASRRSYKEEVGRELDLESKWIRADNSKMLQEKNFHQALIEKLQAGNAELSSIAQELEQQVSELERKDALYAAASLRNGKVLNELQQKHALLTSSLAQVRAEAVKQRQAQRQQRLPSGASMSSSSSMQNNATPALPAPSSTDMILSPLQEELGKLQALTALKARENSAIERQLHLLQTQASDVEALALESLARVKREIVVRRRAAHGRAMEAHQRALESLTESMYQPAGAKFGASFISSGYGGGGGDSRVPEQPQPPVLDERKITLADFTLHDRERVLQLLFEKLNEQNGSSAPGQPQAKEDDSRPSSALSLYTGARRAGSASSSTSLVVSRPASSTRSRPSSSAAARKTAGRTGSATRTRPLPTDMRPSEYVQLSGLSAATTHNAAAGSRAQRAQQQRRGGDEKESSFFPPRGDTPTELL